MEILTLMTIYDTGAVRLAPVLCWFFLVGILGDHVNAQTGYFKNTGTPPDLQGAWIGVAHYADILYNSTMASVWIKDGIPVAQQTQFVSWECMMGQTAAETIILEVGANGTVLGSKTQCLIAKVDGDIKVIQYYNDCEEVKPIVGDVNNDYTTKRYIDFRLNSTQAPAPESFVCSQNTSSGVSTAGNVTMELQEVGSTITPEVPPTGSDFPPSYSDDLQYVAILNGLFMNPDRTIFLNNGVGFASMWVEEDGSSYCAFGEYTGYKKVKDDVYQSTGLGTFVLSGNGSVSAMAASCSTFVTPEPDKLGLGSSLNGDNTACPTVPEVNPYDRLYFSLPGGDIENTPNEEKIAASAMDLDGANQSPPIATIKATANFTMTVPQAEFGLVYFDLDISNINGYTMAHIHQGNETTNGPVVVKLIPLQNNWPTPTMTSDGLIMMSPPLNGSFEFLGAFSEKDFVGPLENSSMAEFIKGLSDPQNYYVNVHTEEYPAGAIRAQLQMVDSSSPPPPSVQPEPSSSQCMFVLYPFLAALTLFM